MNEKEHPQEGTSNQGGITNDHKAPVEIVPRSKINTDEIPLDDKIRAKFGGMVHNYRSRPRPKSNDEVGTMETGEPTKLKVPPIGDIAAVPTGDPEPQSDNKTTIACNDLPGQTRADVAPPQRLSSDSITMEETIRQAVHREFMQNLVVAEDVVVVQVDHGQSDGPCMDRPGPPGQPTSNSCESNVVARSNESVRRNVLQDFFQEQRHREFVQNTTVATTVVAVEVENKPTGTKKYLLTCAMLVIVICAIIVAVVLVSKGGDAPPIAVPTIYPAIINTQSPTSPIAFATLSPTFIRQTLSPTYVRPTIINTVQPEKQNTTYKALLNGALRAAIDAYLSNDESQKAAIAKLYGDPIGSWNVSLVTDFSSAFAVDKNSLAEFFNEDISGWDTSSARKMAYMFYGASAFSGDLSRWDTSQVTNMEGMFFGASSFNSDLSRWNTSKVTNMSYLFYLALTFAGDLSNWDTSQVTDLSFMFYGASNFNSDLSRWNTGKVANLFAMFCGASVFTSDLSLWNTSQVTDMQFLFSEASSFNADLSRWDTSKVTNMTAIFQLAPAFTSDLSNWDTSQVTDMSFMFFDASSFNSSLNRWETSQVTGMDRMFCLASNFDSDLSQWDTNQVTNMHAMFFGASKFNANLDRWNVLAVTDMSYMFQDASAFNFSLCSWARQLRGKNVLVDKMFRGTSCPFKSDPKLGNTTSTSFCFSCE